MKRLTAIFFFLLCAFVMQAQGLAVQSFRLLETDLTAATAGSSQTDSNGEVAALIKVVTPETGFVFDCGQLGIVKTVQTPGEIWVYVPRRVQKLIMKHQQLGVLRDYYFPVPIEGARTYELVLKTSSAKVEAPKTQKLIINYTPTSAMVLVDSKPYKGNGHIETALPLGSHNYIIAAEGYETIEGSFKLTASAPRTFTENLVSIGSLQREEYLSSVLDVNADGSMKNEQGNTKVVKNADVDVLGIDVRPVTDSQKKQLEIQYGLEVVKVNGGKMKEAGVPKGFIIQRINDEPMKAFDDLQKAVKDASQSKDQMLLIRGVFPTGKRGGFVVYLQHS